MKVNRLESACLEPWLEIGFFGNAFEYSSLAKPGLFLFSQKVLRPCTHRMARPRRPKHVADRLDTSMTQVIDLILSLSVSD